MTLFMDVHHLGNGVSADDVATAHKAESPANAVFSLIQSSRFLSE